MLLLVPMLSFLGIEPEIADAQGSRCMVPRVTLTEIYVSDNEEFFFDISDPWWMELYLYDDDAVTYPAVWGGEAEYLDDFRIEGNHVFVPMRLAHFMIMNYAL
jgi:hypothetical protein